MTRLLVTGGAGFIGSQVVGAALSAGWRVRVLDVLDPAVHRRAPQLPDSVELVQGDVADAATIDAALEGVDVVSHQAAKVGMGVDIGDAPAYSRANVGGTAELVAALARAGVSRLVLASSMVVYGDGRYTDGRMPRRAAARRLDDLRAGRFEPRDAETGEFLAPALTDEDAPTRPRSLYAVTKLAQEQLVEVWVAETGGTAAMLRYHNVYGPHMPRDTPYAGVAAIFRSALARGEAPQVLEDGGQRRDFVHVHDVATANVAAAEWTARVDGRARAFNVGSGTVSTILDVARTLSEAVGGREPVVTGGFRPGDVRHITASSERARGELGWAPEVAPEAGLREFATSPLRE